MKPCYECSCGGEEPTDAVAKHHDPRIPPIDGGICLCDKCFIEYGYDRIDELKAEFNKLLSDINKVEDES